MEEKAAVEDGMGGGGGAAADADADDLGEGMQCSEHPYRTNPGGICAFCLQEKLGNLLSAAAPNSFFTTTTTTTTTTPLATTTTTAASAAADLLLLKATSCNKSVAPRPLGDVAIVVPDSPRKKKHFWSFLYHSSTATATAKINQQQQQQQQQQEESADAESSTGGSSSSFGRKVGRSRSVGCGSRSFSGDFLERISTGFGDCTLRRVESQRESRKRAPADGKMAPPHRNVRESRIKERVRCGGIFRGLGMGSTSSSSSSYWLSSSAAEDESSSTISRMSSKTSLRNRNWGWAFASPMRAFKPSSRPANTVASINISTSSSGKISNGNPPSSLAVGGGGS